MDMNQTTLDGLMDKFQAAYPEIDAMRERLYQKDVTDSLELAIFFNILAFEHMRNALVTEGIPEDEIYRIADAEVKKFNESQMVIRESLIPSIIRHMKIAGIQMLSMDYIIKAKERGEQLYEQQFKDTAESRTDSTDSGEPLGGG